MTDTSHELSIERLIDAPVERVWDIMTRRQAEWWCPRPWRAEIIVQDWRAGGRSSMMFHGPDGEQFPQEGIILEVTPGRRFVVTDAVDHEWRPMTPFMIGIFEIEPRGDATLYRATARHWTEEAMRQHEEMGFAEGWTAAAAQLAELAEAG